MNVLTSDDGSVEVFTAFEDFGAVKDQLEAAGFASEAADVSMIPATTTELDLDTAENVIRLVDMLEDLDDVQNVYSNADIPDAVLEQMS